MPAYPIMPGVPAAGHVMWGYWHPGPMATCRKCQSRNDFIRKRRRPVVPPQ